MIMQEDISSSNLTIDRKRCYFGEQGNVVQIGQAQVPLLQYIPYVCNANCTEKGGEETKHPMVSCSRHEHQRESAFLGGRSTLLTLSHCTAGLVTSRRSLVSHRYAVC